MWSRFIWLKIRYGTRTSEPSGVQGLQGISWSSEMLLDPQEVLCPTQLAGLQLTLVQLRLNDDYRSTQRAMAFEKLHRGTEPKRRVWQQSLTEGKWLTTCYQETKLFSGGITLANSFRKNGSRCSALGTLGVQWKKRLGKDKNEYLVRGKIR